MREDVQHRFFTPPRLVVVDGVLREATLVHDCVLGPRRRPFEWRRFAAIVETRPHETAGQPGPVGDGLPRLFRRLRPTERVHTVSRHLGQAPTTMGILCDPKHPALAEFSTEFHNNWQWWYLVHRA